MGIFTKDIKTMDDLFVHQLRDIYYAEQQLVKALPEMADKATDAQTKKGILSHFEETKGHVTRLPHQRSRAAEHYENTRYGSLVAWARQLGRGDCAQIPQKTLEEEKAAGINLRAASKFSVANLFAAEREMCAAKCH